MKRSDVLKLLTKTIWEENLKYSICQNMTKFEARNFASICLAAIEKVGMRPTEAENFGNHYTVGTVS